MNIDRIFHTWKASKQFMPLQSVTVHSKASCKTIATNKICYQDSWKWDNNLLALTASVEETVEREDN